MRGDVAIITSAALAFSARDFLSRQREFARGGAEARRMRGDVAIITSAALAFSARDFHL